MEAAGANTSHDYQEVTGQPNQDYIWGKEVNVHEIQRGDILQFRHHEIRIIYDIMGKVTLPDGKTELLAGTYGRLLNRPWHSAVVSSNQGKGALVIFEQHVNTPGKNPDTVQENRIYISNQGSQKAKPEIRSYDLLSPRDVMKLSEKFNEDLIQNWKKKYKKGKIKVTEEKRTFKVEVTGTIRAYRPEPKKEEK